MKLWGKKASSTPEEEQPRPSRRRKEIGPERTGVNAAATRLTVMGTYGLIGLAALGGAVGLSTAVSSAEPMATQEAYVATTSAEGAALTYITAWLQSTQSDQKLIKNATGAGLPVAPIDPIAFTGVSVAAAERTQDKNVVSVTVSALVDTQPAPKKSSNAKATSSSQDATADPEPARAPSYELRYWQLAVHEGAEGQMQVVGHPTPVPAPSREEQELTLGYPVRLDPSTELGQTVTGFLQSYAAGVGEASRWVAPGAPVHGISPAPYSRVDVQEIRTTQALDDQSTGQPLRLLVQAEAELPSAEGSKQAITIALTMQNREDRWEVTAVDPAPVIAGPTRP